MVIARPMHVLVINCGSSSIKSELIDTEYTPRGACSPLTMLRRTMRIAFATLVAVGQPHVGALDSKARAALARAHAQGSVGVEALGDAAIRSPVRCSTSISRPITRQCGS